MNCIHGIHHTQPCYECDPTLTRIYICSCGHLFDPSVEFKKGIVNATLEFFSHIGHGHTIIKTHPGGTVLVEAA